MSVEAYVDLTPRPGHAAAPVMPLALRVLHDMFSRAPGRCALALPDYPHALTRLRVFGLTSADVEPIIERGRQHMKLRACLDVSELHAVPPAHDGGWLSYRRYRIPTRKAERHPDGNLRLRRMQAADVAQLPYFAMSSTSTGQCWRLYIQAENVAVPGDFAPDGYGLARASQPFGLPVLP